MKWTVTPKVAMKDVAALAGVSTSTVSRALTSPDLVAEATRDRVMVAARQVGYRLAGSEIKVGTLGLIVPDIENPFFASVVKGAQQRAQARGYNTYVADFDEDRTVELELMAALARSVDCLILCSPRADEETIRATGQDVQLVIVNRQLSGFPSVVIDEQHGVRQVLAHLYNLGHRHIAWADGPRASWSGAQRRRHLTSTVNEFEGMSLTHLGHFRPDYSGGMVAADQVPPSGPTAVVAYCSIMALGVIARLQARGVNVPQDLSVVGFDDLAMAGLVVPRLTTVQVSLRNLGRTAVDLAITAADTDSSPANVELPSELMIRDSTGVVRATKELSTITE